jgi:hypothetical protein
VAPETRLHFPASLEYRDEARVELPRRGEVPVARFTVRFNASPKPVATGFQQAWAAKPQVSCDGQAMFPEIAVLTLFQKEGWDGAWADVARRRYFSRMPTLSKGLTLDTHVSQLVARIASAGEGTGAACWELIVWHGRSVFFAAVRDGASLAQGGPLLRKSETAWLEAGLRSGLAPQQFVLVEWDYRRVVVGRKRSGPAAGSAAGSARKVTR